MMNDSELVRLRAATIAAPEDAGALLALGRALFRYGRYGVAADAFREAARIAEDDPDAQRLLGEALYSQGKLDPALDAYAEACARAPMDDAIWQRRADLLCTAPTRLLGGRHATHLLACLEHDELDHRLLIAAGAAGLAAQPSVAALLAVGSEIPAFNDERLSFPLLLALLSRGVIPDRRFELWLIRLRRTLLLDDGARGSYPGALAVAVALQSAASGFLWPETPVETEAVADLAAVLHPADWPRVCILAAYRPLAETHFAEVLLRQTRPDRTSLFYRLVSREIDEPRTERAIGVDIPALGKISDPVSQTVATQYEQNPYPRWTGLPMRRQKSAPAVLCELFPRLRADPPVLGDPLRILIAGCGTGLEAFMVQRRFAGAEILAVDLSRRSLAYAVRRQRELKVEGIKFAQADLLNPMALEDRKFEMIFSTGVLHHLRAPMEGWRALRTRLAAGGFMRIGLYSQRARTDIARVQDFVRRGGYPATSSGIREFREAVLADATMPVDEILRLGDFYTTPECRDLFFHVMEHTFTLPEIEAAIETLGLAFVGFEHPDPGIRTAYAAEHPEDPDGRLLTSWDAFERRHPDTFKAMYQFWLHAP